MALLGSSKALTVGSFTAIGVGVGGAVVASQKGSSEEKSHTQNLSTAKESTSTVESPSSPAKNFTLESCSIVQINGPSKAGEAITKTDKKFDLTTLKSQEGVNNEGSNFYSDVSKACQGDPTKKGVNSSNGRTVYVTNTGGSGNYSQSYQKDWEREGGIRK